MKKKAVMGLVALTLSVGVVATSVPGVVYAEEMDSFFAEEVEDVEEVVVGQEKEPASEEVSESTENATAEDVGQEKEPALEEISEDTEGIAAEEVEEEPALEEVSEDEESEVSEVSEAEEEADVLNWDTTGDIGCSWEYKDGVFSLKPGMYSGGYMYDVEDPDERGWNHWLSDIKTVVVEEGVGNIGKNAFNGFVNCHEVYLPHSLYEIGVNAFYNMPFLATVNVNKTENEWSYTDIKQGNDVLTGSQVHYNYEQGEINYSFDKETGILSFTGKGQMENYIMPTNRPWHECMKDVKEIRVGEGITYIGIRAFWFGDPNEVPGAEAQGYMDSKVEKVVLPSTLGEIQESAFEGCTKLTNINLGSCTSLRTIGKAAFQSCTSLADINLPSSLKAIEGSAFDRCALTSISIPDSISVIEHNTFYGTPLESVKFPSGLTQIGSTAFDFCEKLKSISLPDKLSIIEDGAFGNCTSLESVSVPKSLKTVKKDAFLGCTKIKDVYYDGVLSEWNKINFNNNSYLTKATIYFKEAQKYTVAFKDGNTTVDSRNIEEGGGIGNLPVVEGKTGHTFLGWYTAVQGGSQITSSTKATSNLVCYARWKKNVYKVYFKDGNTVKWKYDVAYGNTIGSVMNNKLPNVSKAGFTFSDWYTAKSGGKKVSVNNAITKDTSFYARWTKVSVGKPSIKKLTAKSKGFTVTWSKVTGVKGYEIRYCGKSNMKGYKTKNAAASKTSFTVSGLSKKKKYYVQVAAYKPDSTGKKVYGVSAKKNVKTK